MTGTATDPDHFRSGGFYARFATDTFDNVHFPNHGNLSRLAFGLVRESLGADDDYEILRGRASQAFTFKKNSVLLTVSGQTTWGASKAAADVAFMGGFLNLSGLDRYQLAGQHAFQGRIITYRRIAAPGALSFSYPIYAGLSFETGNVSQVRNDLFNDLIMSGSAFLGMETPLGPLYFGYGYAEGNRDSFYLFLGRPF